MLSKSLKAALVVAACIAFSTDSASAGWPMGLGGAYARRFIGPAIRQANPYAYGAVLAASRSVPPQVKNGVNRGALGPYRGGYNPYAGELNYWRSMPPEVRNQVDKQQRMQRQQQMSYAQPPQTLSVPVPSAPVPPGAGATNAIPVPPPPSELPRIIRP
jgi:hypothetical protein